MTAPLEHPPRPVSIWPFALAGALTGLVLAVVSRTTTPGSTNQYMAQAVGVALVWAAVLALTRVPIRGHRPRWQGILLAASTTGLATAVVSWGLDRLWGTA